MKVVTMLVFAKLLPRHRTHVNASSGDAGSVVHFSEKSWKTLLEAAADR